MEVEPRGEVESLVGLSRDEAERMVRQAGYRPRTVGYGRPTHADYKGYRITLWVGEDGKVRRASQV